MLPKSRRINKENDFRAVFEKGDGLKQNFLLLKFLKNNLNYSRFGVIVGSKVSKKAVVRNKIKRRLRWLIWKNINQIKKGIDVIFVVLPGAENKNFKEIKEIFQKIIKEKRITP